MTRMKASLILTTMLAGALAGLFGGCKEDEPPVVWDPAVAGAPEPVITAAAPPASALGNITEVTLTGNNFSPIDSQNVVYFGKDRARLKSASATSLVVIPPDLDLSGLTINVVVKGAYKVATYGPYKIEHAGIEYGGFLNLDEVYAIAMDLGENLYAQLKGVGIVKIAPDGSRSSFGTTSFPKASDMKIGPGGALYLAQTNSAFLHRIPATGGASALYATFPGKATVFDFDSSGNIFAGGDGAGMFAANTNATPVAIHEVGAFRGQSIKAIRVFGGYVYALVSTPRPVLYKSRILNANGDLEAATVAFDLANAPTGYATSTLQSLAIAADGMIYIGTTFSDPILTVNTAGTAAPLYPGVLTPPAVQLVWGNSTYLYCNRYLATNPAIRRVIRIAMMKNGAPDYGRK